MGRERERVRRGEGGGGEEEGVFGSGTIARIIREQQRAKNEGKEARRLILWRGLEFQSPNDGQTRNSAHSRFPPFFLPLFSLFYFFLFIFVLSFLSLFLVAFLFDLSPAENSVLVTD